MLNIHVTQPMRFIQSEVTTSSICYIVPEQMHFALLNSIYWCITFCLSCSMRKYVQTAMHWNLPSKDNFPFLYTKMLKTDTQFTNSNNYLLRYESPKIHQLMNSYIKMKWYTISRYYPNLCKTITNFASTLYCTFVFELVAYHVTECKGGTNC